MSTHTSTLRRSALLVVFVAGMGGFAILAANQDSTTKDGMILRASSDGAAGETPGLAGSQAATPPSTPAGAVVPAVSAVSPADAKAALDYWTDERVAKAAPAPTPQAASEGVETPAGAGSPQPDGQETGGAATLYDPKGNVVPSAPDSAGSTGSSAPTTTGPPPSSGAGTTPSSIGG